MRLTGTARKALAAGSRVLGAIKGGRRPTVLELEGLRGRVEVVTDAWGVPHVYADSAHDLFFAQGYVTARDRAFQMDYNRHAASGRLCELVGNKELPWRELTVHLKERTTLDVDVLLRTFGLRRAAEASLGLHSPEARGILEAYAGGVNAFFNKQKRSLEHRILRAQPPPWTPVDSLLMVRAIAFELNFAWRAVLLGALIDAAGVPDDLARRLWPHFPEGGPSIVDKQAMAQLARAHAADRQAADAALGFGNAAGVGSNCFAVAGSHTASGDALLANDTHLTLTAPVPWHEVHLEGGGFELHGYALAGLPGIAIGRTPQHAWGMTAGLVQDLDLFAERLDGERVLTPSGWEPLERRDETFVVREEPSVVRPIYSSKHGPLLESVATQAPAGHRFAISWTGHLPGRDLDSLLGVWKARSFQEFEQSLSHHVCPTFNVTYAGKDGRVAYLLAGVIPKRKRMTPLKPLPGWTGEWDWEGKVPYAENPRLIDPPQGFVITANNRVAPDSYPYELGGLFEPPERFTRITERLAALGDKVVFEDMVSIQGDDFSDWGLRAREALVTAAGGKQALNPGGKALHQSALEQWLAWDGRAQVGSAGAAIGYTTAWTAGRMLARRLAGEDAALGFLELASFICQPVLDLVAASPRLREVGVDVPALVREAFEHAVDLCRVAMGDDPAAWRWGELHPLVCKHRFHSTPLGPFFSIGPEPAPGGPDTVNRGDLDGANSFRLRVGPAMRFVVSARDRDRAGTILPGGQSGDRLSPHYDDQLPLFLEGRLKPAPVSREAITGARELLLPR